MQGAKRLLSTKAINMSLLPTTQNILFPSFTPIPGRYFHVENSVWSLAAYQLIWTTTCIASMEGTLIFPWPKPNCWNKTELQLMLLWLATSTLQWRTADGETLSESSTLWGKESGSGCWIIIRNHWATFLYWACFSPVSEWKLSVTIYSWQIDT